MKKEKLSVLVLAGLFMASCALDTAKVQNVDPDLKPYDSQVVYQKGELVFDNGHIYKALTTVRGAAPSMYLASDQNPRMPWAVYSGFTVNGKEIPVATVPVWDSKTVYLANDPVQRFNKYYKSFWWNQSLDPDDKENQNNVVISGQTYWGPWLNITKEQAESLLKPNNTPPTNGGTVPPDPTPPVGTNVPPSDVTPEIAVKYAWNRGAVYLSDEVSIFNNIYFKAKWWTQGNEPIHNPVQSWDTPWQVITKEEFLRLVSGTPPPSVTPTNSPPSPTNGPPSPTNTPPSPGYDFLYKNGYIQEWDANDAALPERLKDPVLEALNKKPGQSAKDFFTKHLSKDQWEQLFPRRIGTPAWSQTSGKTSPDYYSYANFEKALDILGNYVYFIEVVKENGIENTFFQKNYVLNRTTKKVRLINQAADYFASDNGWLVNKPHVVKTIDYNAFGTEGTDNDKYRIIAGFLAHASHETSGSWATAPGFAFDKNKFPGANFPPYITKELPGELAWSLYFNEEVAYSGSSSSPYTDYYNKTFPPTSGQSYHGRGAFQLSWNYNYGLASAIFFGTSKTLLDNPNMIIKGGQASGTWINEDIQGGTLAFLTSLMFWLTPQGAKPSQQDTMVLNRSDGKYIPKVAKLDAAPRLGTPGYGWTINIMNGGYEADKSWEEGNPKYDAKVARRVKHYLFFTQALGGNNKEEILDTLGNHSY